MSLGLKICICVWIYLSIGIGVVLISQVVASKMRDSDFDDWYWYLKIDPESDDFGGVVLGLTIFWPFMFLAILYFVVEKELKKIFELIWKDKED